MNNTVVEKVAGMENEVLLNVLDSLIRRTASDKSYVEADWEMISICRAEILNRMRVGK